MPFPWSSERREQGSEAALRYPVITLEVRRILWNVALEAAMEALVEGSGAVHAAPTPY